VITADTNVLVYLWDTYAPGKTSVAQTVAAMMTERGSRLALQVVGETQNVLLRKLRQPAWQAAENARTLLTAYETFQASAANASEALTMMASGRFSYWDGLLVTAARDAECRIMLSEDMQDGQRLGDLEVVNPFGEDGPSSRLRELLAA
jgi:predicted nucleic acid-binding protein